MLLKETQCAVHHWPGSAGAAAALARPQRLRGRSAGEAIALARPQRWRGRCTAWHVSELVTPFCQPIQDKKRCVHFVALKVVARSVRQLRLGRRQAAPPTSCQPPLLRFNLSSVMTHRAHGRARAGFTSPLSMGCSCSSEAKNRRQVKLISCSCSRSRSSSRSRQLRLAGLQARQTLNAT